MSWSLQGTSTHGTRSQSKERPLTVRLGILIQSLIVVVAVVAGCPASAQIYRWVDDSGITNYSSKPPANPKSAQKLELIMAKAAVDTSSQAPSVIRAAPSTLRTLQPAPADVTGEQRYLLDRINNLERQVQAERQARQYESELQASQYAADLEAQQYAAQSAAPSPPATYDPCIDSQYDGCNGNAYGYGVYYPWPVVAVVPVYHRPRRLIRTPPVTRMPGVARGNAFTTFHNHVISATPTSGRAAGGGRWR